MSSDGLNGDEARVPKDGGGRLPLFAVGAALLLVGVGLLAFAVLRDRGEDSAANNTASGSSTTAAPMVFDLTGLTTATTTPTVGLGEGWASPARGRRALSGFGEFAGVVTAPDGTTCDVCLLAALSGDQHERGLMEVTDKTLGGYDGMIFVFPGEQQGSFWMRNTPMPLSIAYLDTSGRAVTILDMDPCEDSPSCPGYPPSAPFRFALEVPQGEFERLGLEKGSVLQLTGTTCPLAKADR